MPPEGMMLDWAPAVSVPTYPTAQVAPAMFVAHGQPPMMRTATSALPLYETHLEMIHGKILAVEAQLKRLSGLGLTDASDALTMERRSLGRWLGAMEDKLRAHHADIALPREALVARLRHEQGTRAELASLAVAVLAVWGILAAITAGATVGLLYLFGVPAKLVGVEICMAISAWPVLSGVVRGYRAHPTELAAWLHTPPAYDKDGCYSDHCSCRVA